MTLAGVLALGPIALAGQAIARNGSEEEVPRYAVEIPPGVTPVQPVEKVAEIVLGQLGPEAKIDKITVVASAFDVASVEPNGARPIHPGEETGVSWIVRGRGEFVGMMRRDGTLIVGKSGFYVVDDDTGEILEMGIP